MVLGAIVALGCGGSEPGGSGREGAGPDAGAPGAAPSQAAPADPLADSNWRLVEFQSMDDAVGTTRPEDASLYTMHLGADGSVSMRLNCNRANGTWSAEPGDDGRSGTFEFGPLATTRALCPPPSMDEQIAAQAEWVRSYLLEDGRLNLSLMADGGIYVWEPDTRTGGDVPFETAPDAELEAAIRATAPDYTRESVEILGQKARYVYAHADLDGDGTDEVFVYLLGPFFCGTGGCDLLLFSGGPMGYGLISDFPISRTPVIVSGETSAGWSNLVRRESGGGRPASWVTHTFDGERYVEHDRSGSETEPPGTKVLAGEITFETATPLEPAN